MQSKRSRRISILIFVGILLLGAAADASDSPGNAQTVAARMYIQLTQQGMTPAEARADILKHMGIDVSLNHDGSAAYSTPEECKNFLPERAKKVPYGSFKRFLYSINGSNQAVKTGTYETAYGSKRATYLDGKYLRSVINASLPTAKKECEAKFYECTFVEGSEAWEFDWGPIIIKYELTGQRFKTEKLSEKEYREAACANLDKCTQALANDPMADAETVRKFEVISSEKFRCNKL